MFKKKKTLGIEAKPKSVDELNQEYSRNAAELGHKMMLTRNTQNLIEKTQGEMDQHITTMTRIRQQINELPPPTPPTPAPSDAATEGTAP